MQKDFMTGLILFQIMSNEWRSGRDGKFKAIFELNFQYAIALNLIRTN